VPEWHNLDTRGYSAAAARLRDYIQGLSIGTVLVGVSCDTTHPYLSDMFPTLSALGANVSDVTFWGAFVFAA